MFNWFKNLWEHWKPTIKGAIIGLIRTKLKPEMVKFIDAKKGEIVSALEAYSAEENAEKACNWLEEYFDRQL